MPDSVSRPGPAAGSQLAAETPAHYIVFTAEAGGDPAPVFHRLVVVDDAAVLAAAAAVPNWDRILVLVNDITYGGSGGPLLGSSVHPQAPDIIRHEYGHSFTGLADEYDTPFPGFPACSDVSGRLADARRRPRQLARLRLALPQIAPVGCPLR